MQHHLDHRAKCLHIVYDGGIPQIAFLHGKRRPVARLTALALGGFYQCGFFAAYIRPCAELYPDIKVKPFLPCYIFAQQLLLAQFIQNTLQKSFKVFILIAQIQNALRCPNGVGSHCHPFKQQPGPLRQYNPVLKCARLAFVGIAKHKPSFPFCPAAKIPLQPCRKTSTTATPEIG